MKKLIPFIAILFLVSCEEANDLSEPSTLEYRLVEEVMFNEIGDSTRTIYEYNSDKLAQVIVEKKYVDKSWSDRFMYNFSYDDVRVNVDCYCYYSDSFRLCGKDYFLIGNDRIHSYMHHSPSGGDFIETNRADYYYNDDFIARIVDRRNDDGRQTYTYDFFNYEDDKIKFIIVGYSGYSSDSVSFVYDSNLIEEIHYKLAYTPYKAIEERKTMYFLEGERAVIKKNYSWDDVQEVWDFSSERTYMYDENGYLIKEIDDYGDGIVYKYELGMGNVTLLLTPPEDLFDFEPDAGIKY